jgi:hypothetical protein
MPSSIWGGGFSSLRVDFSGWKDGKGERIDAWENSSCSPGFFE